jgi:hypothetical protein
MGRSLVRLGSPRSTRRPSLWCAVTPTVPEPLLSVTRFDRPDYTPHGPSPRAIARSRAPGDEPPNQQSEEPLLT